MCGIWALLGSGVNSATQSERQEPTFNPEPYIAKLKGRGPEQSAYKTVLCGYQLVHLGFTRLAINGLTAAGDQPMRQGDGLHWICNGEIYNYKDLAARHGIALAEGSSDCQVIGPLYEQYADDLPTFFRALDGVFALVIVDTGRARVIVGRDPYGVRPLFMADGAFASEMKALPSTKNAKAFQPGSYTVWSFTDPRAPTPPVHNLYHTIPFLKVPALANQEAAEHCIAEALEVAVKKRMLTERPVAALLSGGIDSSLIAALVAKELRAAGAMPLKTFSIGFAGSEDLRFARMVAAWIGSDHHEVIATPDEFFAAIPEVIKAIESYDTTTVRASVGNYLVAKAVAARSDCKVVFNGDGSDEVFGSYMYFYSAPSDEAFEAESERLLRDMHYFDVLRSDRSISSHGLEPRTPFLDKQFVATARAVATQLRRPVTGIKPEKWILRRAFADSGLLPNDVLWRKKEAFSDGVSGPTKLWYEEIQERLVANSAVQSEQLFPAFTGETPAEAERKYYKGLFDQFYPNCESVTVPYRWMPRWSPGATDPSARTLVAYSAANAAANAPKK
jgi:asparagine synthase (glutamine-hydrolysing)